MTVGVAGLGAYAPAARLSTETIEDAWGTVQSRGVTKRAVPAADEDPLTMAAEAGERALSAAGMDAAALRGIVIGTTTPPVEEEALIPRLASFLAAPSAVAARQLTGSTRAGVAGLVAGADLVAEADGPVLVVAADAPRGAPDAAVEHAAGAGAAGVLLIPPERAGGSLGDRATVTSPAPGTRFRPRGETETRGLGVTQYDRDVYVETVTDAVDALGADPSEADAVALQAPNGSLPYRAAGALGVESDRVQRATTVHELGDTGAASPLLGLSVAVDEGATDLLLVGYGSGSVATAAHLDVGGVSVETAIEAGPELSYPAALRIRGDLTPGHPDGGGAYVSVPSWRRTIPQRHRLVAGRCRDCGEIAYPPTGACDQCGTLDDYDDVRLPGTGTVEAATKIGQGGAPPEFADQQARSGSYVSAIVGLDCPGGGTVSAPFQVVSSGDTSVSIGDRVTGTVRRLYTQEGVTRYTVKMTAAE